MLLYFVFLMYLHVFLYLNANLNMWVCIFLGLDYVLAHLLGVYTSCSVYLVLYCIWQRNVPSLYPRTVLPGLLSGAMWSVAQVATFIGNQHLSMTVTFPITQTGPGVVAALLSVFLFHEIQVFPLQFFRNFAHIFNILLVVHIFDITFNHSINPIF